MAGPLALQIGVPGCALRPAQSQEAPAIQRIVQAVLTQSLPPLPPAALAPMLAQQASAQSAAFDRDHPGAVDHVLTRDGLVIGRLLACPEAQPLHLVDLAIDPPWQGQGLGTALLRAVCAHAGGQGRAVTLRALEGQGAARLYARLGFEITDHAPPYVAMRWSPV